MAEKRHVRWGDLVGGTLVGALLLGPASMLLGAYFDRPTALAVIGFGSAPLVGLVLALFRRTRFVGVGVLIGVALFWIVVVPICAVLLGG